MWLAHKVRKYESMSQNNKYLKTYFTFQRVCKNSTERVHGSLDLLAGLPAPGTPQGCNTLSRPGRAHGVRGGRRAV